jgi:hypothetical protein
MRSDTLEQALQSSSSSPAKIRAAMRISQPFCTIAKAQLGYAAALLTVVVDDDRVCYKTGGHQQRDITKRKDEVDIETQPEILQHPTRNEKADTYNSIRPEQCPFATSFSQQG